MENIFNSICRLCLNYTDPKKMVPLIDENSPGGLTPHAKAVSTFAHINFTKEDCFPSYMCSKCLNLLKQAITFKLITESSDKCLKNLKASVGSDNETLKEKIVELTIFKFYFPTECSKKTHECANNEINSHQHSNNDKENINRIGIQCSSDNSINDDIVDISTPESANPEKILPKDKLWNKLENIFGTCKLKSKIPNVLEKTKKSYYPCNVCNKVMSNKFSYERHIQMHNGYRYICEHCGKGYAILQPLQVHRIAKHGTGPYLECSQCSFKAYNNYFLNKHVRIVHAGERPYKCEKCGMAFLRLHTYKKHFLRHSERKIQCPKCPMKFFLRGDMLSHLNNIHTRKYLYGCSECDKSYTSREHVKRHMFKIHGIPRNMQGKIICRINIESTAKEESESS